MGNNNVRHEFAHFRYVPNYTLEHYTSSSPPDPLPYVFGQKTMERKEAEARSILKTYDEVQFNPVFKQVHSDPDMYSNIKYIPLESLLTYKPEPHFRPDVLPILRDIEKIGLGM